MNRLALIFVALSFCCVSCCAQEAKKLSDDDKTLLDRTSKELAVDPTNAQWISFKSDIPDAWGKQNPCDLHAWLISDKATGKSRLLDFDGDGGTPPKEFAVVDFKTYCTDILKPPKEDNSEGPTDLEKIAQPLRCPPPALLRAAWLYKLGFDDAAAQTLAATSTAPFFDDDLFEAARHWLAWRQFAGAVHAYMQRMDDEAHRRISIFCAKYADWNDQFSTKGTDLLAELERRKKLGSFGNSPAEQPQDVADWTLEKRIAWLIDQLDQVEVRQSGQPGWFGLTSDWRMKGLIDIGEAAIPALVDCFEKDKRLTRSASFFRDFHTGRFVSEVCWTAYYAFEAILQTRVIAPASGNEKPQENPYERRKDTAKQLRAYWETYGKFPYDERMMKILVSKDSSLKAIREAAEKLAHLGPRRDPSETIWSTGLPLDDPDVKQKALAKFTNPTIAEAILAAMDRTLIDCDRPSFSDTTDGRERSGIEHDYLKWLVDLGDKRIEPTLKARWSAEKNVRMRRKYAFACLGLGDDAPFKSFCAEVEAGTIVLPKNDGENSSDDFQPGNVEFSGMLWTLIDGNIGESRAALLALADPKHPYHAILLDRILNGNYWGYEQLWICLKEVVAKALRPLLDDTTLSGTNYAVKGNHLITTTPSVRSDRSGLPEILKDASKRKDEVDSRKCDEAATKLAAVRLGLPEFHPLLKDADALIAKMKEMLDKK